MSETNPFDPFDAALEVRDALERCNCCPDEDEGQSQFEAAAQLLSWVVTVQTELAALRALVRHDGSVTPRAPLTDAERSKRYRRKQRGVSDSVTKPVTDRHENRHDAVTNGVTILSSVGRASDQIKQQATAAKILEDKKEVAAAVSSSPEDARGERPSRNPSRTVVTKTVTVVTLDAEAVAKEWHAAMHSSGASMAIHSPDSWRSEYETVASAINAAVTERMRPTALKALCSWFWSASTGPIVGRRIDVRGDTLAHLAKRVSRDLDSANAWYADQQAAKDAAQ